MITCVKSHACEVRGPGNLADLLVERKSEKDIVCIQAKIPSKESNPADSDWRKECEESAKETSGGLQEATAVSRIDVTHVENFEKWKQRGENSGNESQRKNDEKVVDSYFGHRCFLVAEFKHCRKSFDLSICKNDDFKNFPRRRTSQTWKVDLCLHLLSAAAGALSYSCQ